MNRYIATTFVCLSAAAILLGMVAAHKFWRPAPSMPVVSGEIDYRPVRDRGGFWLATPPFALKDAEGRPRSMIAALRFSTKAEAEAFCPWMPVLIDRINLTVYRAGQRDVEHGEGLFALGRMAVHDAVASVIENARAADLHLVEVDQQETLFGPSGSPALVCDRTLLDPRQSRLVTG